MGLAASGSVAAGPLVTEGGYITLAVADALTDTLLLPTALAPLARRTTWSTAR